MSIVILQKIVCCVKHDTYVQIIKKEKFLGERRKECLQVDICPNSCRVYKTKLVSLETLHLTLGTTLHPRHW